MSVLANDALKLMVQSGADRAPARAVPDPPAAERALKLYRRK
jgi:hypothetical protein